MSGPDLYQILGVSRFASTAAIKAAFREKAKTTHPDAGGDAEEFRLLTLAYHLLSDPDQRRTYNQTGVIPDVVRRSARTGSRRNRRTAEGEGRAAEITRLRVRQTIGNMLLEVLPCIKTPHYEDVVAILHQTASARLKEIDKDIVATKTLLDTLVVVANRIQAKEGENILRELTLERRADQLKILEELKDRENLYKKVREFLEGYTYYLQIETVLVSSDVWKS
ncbi:J domain-containing protein [Telmatospirillum sp.]|uniref:J domain-containing protein n=1 Tax=Telmatospirillum sp. TaxID=2079197 RepID=UPI0028505F05|nr:J domain-containing protein [Telmatospirillum sp.]MDR3441142.1 J domain-containing protein [Telmatospirillum sp.]